MDWKQKRILVTGGASFISSHLIDHLIEKGARSIRVVDDLSSGKLANIQQHIDDGTVEFVRADLLEPGPRIAILGDGWCRSQRDENEETSESPRVACKKAPARARWSVGVGRCHRDGADAITRRAQIPSTVGPRLCSRRDGPLHSASSRA